MTTFTKLDDGGQPCITVSPYHRLSKVNDNVYGGFAEHMGRRIYGGIYDENGFRKDFIQSFKDINCPVVRYPGGNFVATYHWIDGVGPREKRPRRLALAWTGVESNQFGTDEFMKWCELVGTEPYLALNFGTGTLEEALAWLEYCNSTQDTHYANLRRDNGREKPYYVKYWALGNEVWGPWQVEQMTKEDYAKKAYQWAKALKLVDPSIVLILCRETGHSEWDFYTLKECMKLDLHGLGGSAIASLIDMHSIHIYTASTDPVKNAIAPRAAERAIEICGSRIDLARIQNNVPPTVPRQTICFDEWNVWEPQRAVGSEGAEEKYTLSDALAVGVWLNVFIRQSKYVGMANIAQSMDVISPLMTAKDGLIKQTTWWPLLLFSKYMRGWSVATHVSCDAYNGDSEPKWMRAACDTPWLDVSATIDDDGFASMVVVNTHLSEAREVDVSGLKVGAVVTAQAGVPSRRLLTNITVFDPPDNYSVPRTLYARVRKLDCDGDNTLLATWENYIPTGNSTAPCPDSCPVNPYIPVWVSTDLGETWSERSRVYDTQNGWGLRYQPELYEMTESIGNFSTGTLLLAANSIPADLSETKLDVYASTDKGYTWTFVSSVARGGDAFPENQFEPVWEPFMFIYDGELVFYYSDQRDPNNTLGQKIVHQTTTDLRTWGPVVDDIVYANETWRPGMPIVSELPFGNWIMTFEFFGAVEAEFAVYYRISRNPRTFGSKPDHALVATDGTVPRGSPYNVWTPAGGPLGTIVVSDGNNPELYLNHNLGGGAWTVLNTTAASSYTRALMVMPDDPAIIMIIGGGVLGGEDNSVQVTTVKIEPNLPKFGRCNAGSRANATGYRRQH
nr:hypothetical protein B0A51_07929 [Rachicladosporium sp. CCFEE 5018]